MSENSDSRNCLICVENDSEFFPVKEDTPIQLVLEVEDGSCKDVDCPDDTAGKVRKEIDEYLREFTVPHAELRN